MPHGSSESAYGFQVCFAGWQGTAILGGMNERPALVDNARVEFDRDGVPNDLAQKTRGIPPFALGKSAVFHGLRMTGVVA